MSYKYYDSNEEGNNKFEHGDIQLELKSKKDKYQGMAVRKLHVKHSFLDYASDVTHI